MEQAQDWTERNEEDLKSLEGKYLTYALGEEVYGTNILRVIEIIGVMNITAVPRAPHYVKGVINLRGKIIPVVDLRLKFGMMEKEYNEKTCIIVVDVAFGGQKLAMGMIVDTVLEVRDFDSKSLAHAPKLGSMIDTRFIVGMGRTSNEDVVILIDIDKALGEGDMDMMMGMSSDMPESI